MKIGLLVAYNEDYTALIDISRANKSHYCKIYGYQFILHEFGELDSGRTPHWGKIKAIQQYLGDFDWLVCCDADTLITNKTHKLESFADHRFDIIVSGRAKMAHIDSSILFIKNSAWSREFIDRWYQQTCFIDRPYYADPVENNGGTGEFLDYRDSAIGGVPGMLFEQSALAFLYDTEPETRSKVKKDSRLGGSVFMVYQFNKPTVQNTYINFDFMVHFPGMPLNEKLTYMNEWRKLTKKTNGRYLC